ncbi:MAG TPA: ATP-binding protein, partial [Candidatus Acidoferrales bacterium]|nr:ATP-binding protein [Candidatus Acidoferrales bacterium]
GGTGGRISIRASQRDRRVVVSVEDEGVGIDPAEREEVFERFYRGRQARTGNTPGSGLGLYVCRRLVEAHGGEIWVDDRERGTSISFTLPAAATSRTRRTPAAPWPTGAR